MHIVHVSQCFPPEMGAPAARVYEFSHERVKQGHKVSVVTGFANRPTGVKAPADKWQVTRRESTDGIYVVRCYVWTTANRGVDKRMISYAVFMLSAMLLGAIRMRSPDLVIATFPQLLCGLDGYLLAKRFGVPFVLEVRDPWSESILAVEAMKQNHMIRGLKRLAHFLWRAAAH